MAIYGIGAKYDTTDISAIFLKENFVATGWDDFDAPDLHEYFKVINPGDIVYIKSCSYSSDITVKGVGIVTNDELLTSKRHSRIEIGRNVKWIYKNWFVIDRPSEGKNNVRANTIYREFHPDIIAEIMRVYNRYA
ncbi:hypothetical protein [Mucilaginibacter aquatilis]|uniref:Uncharacterized protein n=1 Tax=Mucilaginibacter aquatilis TaxID=1517760 RepID=A0A6I4ICL4_9SPHI|nr:hypothetical protein [Mucilaginibacter aquatilis]MVN92677.1 hypothetical protein [Mucilaginibacter aquatilis]